MYSINPISRPTLITPDECTAKLPNASIDSKKWVTAIELAEVRFVIPAIGWNMYNDICTNKNIVVTSGNIAALQAIFTSQFGIDQTNGNPNVVLINGMLVNSIDLSTISSAYLSLWNNALWNFVFNCVWLIALTDNYAEFTSSGIQKNNPLDSAIGSTASANVGISLNDLRFLNDNLLLGRINPLQDYLQQWICVNAAQYPLFPYNLREKWNKSGSRTTTFINIYEDEDKCGCNRWNQDSYVPLPAPVTQPVKSTCGITITIATVPNGTLFGLCNLQTIQAQYVPSATTLNIPDLVGKYVMPTGALYNGAPVTIGPVNNSLTVGYNQVLGTFDRTAQGGWNDTDTFSFLYTETM